MCTIFVGAADNKTSFEVPNSVLGQCMTLAGLLKQAKSLDPNSQDTFITLHEHFGITAERFRVVAMFLTKGCFAPFIVKGQDGKAAVCLL